MAGSINKVILVGNLGADPEIRFTQDGKEVASFSLATTESWKDKNTGEKRDKTEWHRIAVFNQGLIGVIKQYIKKGSKIYLEGSLQTRKWTDNSGVEKYTTEIVLQNYNGNIVMLESSGSSGSAGKSNNVGEYSNDQAGYDNGNQSSNQNFAKSDIDDDIPF